MLFAIIIVSVIILAIACSAGGLTAAVIMALVAVLMSGLIAGIAGILTLTNFRQMNYELALERSFSGGAALGAILIALWTAVLDFRAGGLTSSLALNLQYVSLCCAFVDTVLGVLMAVMLGLIWHNRRNSSRKGK